MQENRDRPRPREKILAELAALPPAVQGKICSYTKVRKNGKEAVYHNLQSWFGGKNHSIHVPGEKVEEMEKAVKAGERLMELVYELSAANAEAIISGQPR